MEGALWTDQPSELVNHWLPVGWLILWGVGLFSLFFCAKDRWESKPFKSGSYRLRPTEEELLADIELEDDPEAEEERLLREKAMEKKRAQREAEAERAPAGRLAETDEDANEPAQDRHASPRRTLRGSDEDGGDDGDEEGECVVEEYEEYEGESGEEASDEEE